MLSQELLYFIESGGPPYGCGEVLNETRIRRVNDHGLSIIQSERHFGSSTCPSRQSNNYRARKNVNVVTREIILAPLAAVWQMRIYG
jgi:hypothetical protein